MRTWRFVLLLAASTGCGEANNQKPLSKRAVAAAPIAGAYSPKPGDPESARAADVAILFFGNSHTGGVPERVRSMLRLLEPKKSVYVQAENVGWLEGAANDPRIVKLLQGEPWKAVVLQAQRLSSSGRHQYSRTDGIALAKAAKARGARVLYYSEWGLEGVDGDARHNERVYQLMAEASGAEVAPVGRAWDAALAADPKLPLYAGDGNHQSGAGMFLTSCTLAGAIAGKSPAALAEFADESVAKPERKLLAETAATTLKEMKTPAARPLPKPTGPFAVGTGTLALVDPKRDEVAPSFALAPGADPKPMAAAGKRTVEVFLWYPAERGPRPGESSLYNRDLEFLAQLTKDASIMEAHRALRTWSAPLAKFAEKAKKAPLVVLAPAPGAFVTDCTALAEELASHGIVVASAASPGVTLMRRGDRGGSGVSSRWEGPERAAERNATVAADLRLAFDDLIEHSRKPGSLLHDRLDEAKLGAIGVRASAAAAIKAADDDPRIQVVASIEGPEIQSPRSAKYFRVIGEAPGNATDSPFQFPERYRGGRPAGEVAATILKTTRERLQNSLASATPATR